MKSNSQPIRSCFIKKLTYSALIQFLIFGLVLVLAREYFQYDQFNNISTNLIISDSFTTDEIGRFHILGNKYALDLDLYNLENERKLDSIKFVQTLDETSTLGICQSMSSKNYKLCKTIDGLYTGITPIQLYGNILGYIIAKKQYTSFFSIPISYGLLLILLIVIAIFLFNFLFLFLSMKRKIENNTKYLIDFISCKENKDTNASQIDIDEYKRIAQKFIDEQNEILKLEQERTYYEAHKNIAEQVAHDIRSPLAAINTAISDVAGISESRRIMIKSAAKRINDIANNLLLQSKNIFDESINSNDEGTIFSELIFVVLENIFAEKNYEYCQTISRVQLNVAEGAYSCFSKVNLPSFKRVLSNLINNSIEATTLNDSVIITLKCDDEKIDIIIEDNGCGIPSEILPKVTGQGFSFNKTTGAGFGLSYAKQQIEQLNGQLLISSQINIGTKVIIRLLRSDPPNWFCKSLTIKKGATVVVLDDDPSIHETWKERLSCVSDLELIHFSKINDLILKKNNIQSSFFYLIDYELLGDTKNGLDAIEELALSNNSVLVTSCFEDLSIRSKCEKLGVKIIPKLYVPYIPINLDSSNSLVFIDNDAMMRMIWKFAAEKIGKKISIYPSPNDFNKELMNFDKQTIIYIDAELDDNIQGELYAKELYMKGFREIHLATGHIPERFNNMPWIKSIVDKTPHFLMEQ